MSIIGPHPSLADVARKAAELAVAELHVAIPARVERVDLAKGLVDAKPLVKDSNEVDGERQAVTVPVISNVPLVFPGAGGFRLTFPVKTGDTVLLVFSERSLDKWLGQGGEVDPIDDRRHALSDAIAIPGLRDFAHPWTGAVSDGLTIGLDGGIQIKIDSSTITLAGGVSRVARAMVDSAGPWPIVGGNPNILG